ncbi:hypothetical protein [Amycolatopsis echigonensis]|uniref:Uncharacterized protein n=1 Tax=Amycolatopsis echigonensis TaxID=2576905 RepID=A0A2N3WTT7_9PSEU|nr:MULTISPECIES: hypothetical protein [Amycolatopsis]MBB2501827.1 hypothetical protein [Amycolatopsis echigonensis]PKV97289.1 hypothetical protein ATK30_8264 [Amycolatopsis niigatensis]
MSAVCGPDAEAVTRRLGFDCHDVSPVVSVRVPWELAHWTMPLLEVLIVGGAVFALWHAVRRYRAGDPVNLALWWASLVYLVVTEPPLYFPEWFGLDRLYGFIFAHNRFTVQFMGDRLPLYIVAFYPVISQLAYELVRSLGIFRRRGPLAGAVAVAFACQVFYEVFDQVGPQLGWWAWNPANRIVNQPALASVPMTSMLLFASVSMAAMTYLVVRFTGGRRGWRLVPRILAAGVLTPFTMAVAGLPSSLFGGDHPDPTAQAWVLGVELALVWLAGAGLVVAQLRSGERGTDEPLSVFGRYYPAIYLLGMAVCWIGALPAYLGARDGVTSAGTPIGSGPYALACFVAAGLLLAAQRAAARRDAPVAR